MCASTLISGWLIIKHFPYVHYMAFTLLMSLPQRLTKGSFVPDKLPRISCRRIPILSTLSYKGCPCSGSFFLVKTCPNSIFSLFITVIFIVVLFRTWVDLLKCLSPVSHVEQHYQFFFMENTPESRSSVK